MTYLTYLYLGLPYLRVKLPTIQTLSCLCASTIYSQQYLTQKQTLSAPEGDSKHNYQGALAFPSLPNLLFHATLRRISISIYYFYHGNQHLNCLLPKRPDREDRLPELIHLSNSNYE